MMDENRINPRTKGRKYEYHVRDIIRKYFPCHFCQHKGVRRVPMSGAIDGFKGDIMVCPHSPMKRFGLEVKKVEKINIWKCLQQAINQAERKTPLLFFSRNFDDDYVALKTMDFLSLVKEIEDYKELLHERGE